MINKLRNFQTLNQPMHSGTVSRKFVLNPQFNESLVGNISIIPTIKNQYVIMKLSNGN